MTNRVRLAGTILIVSAAAGLGLATPASAAHHSATAPSGKLVTSRVISLGRILANAKGHTLYMFGKDTAGKSHCGHTCQMYWPPLRSASKPRAGTDVKQRHLARTPSHQVTYFGHPLYYFSGDTGKSHNGEGMSAFGAKWFVVSTNGTAIKPAAAGGGGTPSPPPYPYLPLAPSR